ncbi:MAG: CRISPR-associated endonuclease Cas2 [Acidobacteria bacterium]|nr:CRISPR-associated endonuclease Cas2 [Acidobacteriota bacterium]
MRKRKDTARRQSPGEGDDATRPTDKSAQVRPKRLRPWQGERPGAAAGRLDPASELLTVVVFDIPSDKIRRKAGELCMDYGLQRMQWSAFEGLVTRSRREELWDRLTAKIADAVGGGRVAMYPIGEREARSAQRFDTGPPAEPIVKPAKAKAPAAPAPTADAVRVGPAPKHAAMPSAVAVVDEWQWFAAATDDPDKPDRGRGGSGP